MSLVSVRPWASGLFSIPLCMKFLDSVVMFGMDSSYYVSPHVLLPPLIYAQDYNRYSSRYGSYKAAGA